MKENKRFPADAKEKHPPGSRSRRDFLKLAPGVQYTEDGTRGPSAGGNGQDNVYKIDGVNVGLPLFGTLSSEPAAYDIEQVSFIRGGSKATDFNRSGGSRNGPAGSSLPLPKARLPSTTQISRSRGSR